MKLFKLYQCVIISKESYSRYLVHLKHHKLHGGILVKIKQIKELLSANLLTGGNFLEEEVTYGYGCDLMSDVLAYVQNNVVLLTGLIHPQVIRTAEMLDIKAIVIVRGKEPTEEFVRMAESREIVILTTQHSLFTANGILYNNGLKGEEIAHIETAL